MNNLINTINNYFYEMMRDRIDPDKHLFFSSINWWKNAFKQWSGDLFEVKKILKEKNIDLSTIKPIKECKFNPTKKLSSKYIEDFYELLTNSNTKYKLIQDKCYEMTEYLLPSTIKDISKWKIYDTKNTINVMILGSGPVGLYTALYLHKTYNKPQSNKEFSPKKINIILVDNRIKKEGLKMPYSRATQFGFDILEIQPFLNQIFCWETNRDKYNTRAFDFIYVLENMLYTRAYHSQIPMLFTKQFDDHDNLKKFIEKEDIHFLFDCSGGRTNMKINKNIFKLRHEYKFKEGNHEIVFNKKTKYYEFNEDNEIYTKPIIRLQILDKDNREIPIGNTLVHLKDDEDNESDLELVMKYKDICFTPQDYLKISSWFKNHQLRNLYQVLTKEIKSSTIKSVKLISFYSIARHSPFAATRFTKDCTLIRLGDSLAGTEYGIIFGMKHSIEFSKYICNFLANL